nr:T9SS type A sorting domain-containing protein [uncultured Pontibacter sp.]
MAVYPNPFTSYTSISFKVKQAAQVSVKVLDVTGRQVTTLMEAQAAPGSYELTWDGKDMKKNSLRAGLYFCVIQLGQDKIVKRIALSE